MAQREPLRQQGHVYDDGPPRRGVSDLVAIALVTLDLDTVRRSTLRRLCPEGESKKRPSGKRFNAISDAFRIAIRNFEHMGWIEREDDYIHMKDRVALLEHIAMGVDADRARALSLLAVKETAQQINAELETGTAVPGWTVEQIRRDAEIRHREMLAIKRLMESGPGANHPGGSGSVRIVPRGKSL